MMKTLLLAGMISLAGAVAQAATCGPRAKVIEALSNQYQENPAAAGLSKSGRLFEVLTRRDGASWTVLVTSPEGVSCIIDAGESWISIDLARYDPEA